MPSWMRRYAARAPVFGPCVDVDWPFRYDRPRPECDRTAPDRIGVGDGKAEMHVAGIGGGVGIWPFPATW